MLHQLFPDEIPTDKEETNFPVWIEGCDDASFAPFVPTPIEEVRRSLEMANVTEEDGLFDLGCGDGRFCAVAVVEFGVKKANGIDLEQEAIERGLKIREKLGIDENRFKLVCDDFGSDQFLHNLVNDFDITVLVVVLTADFQRKFASFLKKFLDAREGRRIISLYFNLNDLEGLHLSNTYRHKIFIYEGR